MERVMSGRRSWGLKVLILVMDDSVRYLSTGLGIDGERNQVERTQASYIPLS